MIALKPLFFSISKSKLINNSLWGIVANLLQMIFASLFFIILARNYSADLFAKFLLASAIYQLLVAFSSMGLGPWFSRELLKERDKTYFINKFLKLQLGLGAAFYLINIFLTHLIYDDYAILGLSLILGINIIFDNVIYVVRILNTVQSEQRKTVKIFAIDGLFKIAIASLLFIFPFSILVLSGCLVSLRLLTVNMFLKASASQTINLKSLCVARISRNDIILFLFRNWRFVLIGSVSIVYWRIANIIVSKFLTLQDVANYEISYRFFGIFQIIPVIAGATIFPKFVEYLDAKDLIRTRKFYERIFFIYTFYSLLSYSFIKSFSKELVTITFGDKYTGAIVCTQHMFLTFIVFPTVLLQANLIIAMKLEKIDMWLNVMCLALYITGCIIGLRFYKSVSIIHYSIFASFIAFHIGQDLMLLRKKITTIRKCFLYYIMMATFVSLYEYLSNKINPAVEFFTSCSVILLISLHFISKEKDIFASDPKKLIAP